MAARHYCPLCVGIALSPSVFLSGQWLETTIQVGHYPCDLVYNPTNNKAYCANNYRREFCNITRR